MRSGVQPPEAQQGEIPPLRVLGKETVLPTTAVPLVLRPLLTLVTAQGRASQRPAMTPGGGEAHTSQLGTPASL